MMKPAALDQPAHTRSRWINARLLLETALLFAALAGLANVVGPQAGQSVGWLAVYLVILLAQGLMLQRLYIIAHEAAHRKLAARGWLNDLLGQVVLLPIFVPLQIYRKIHQFHHGFNRKDVYTSALDVFVSPWPVTPLIKAMCFGLWYLGVFAGGLFLHSLISIVLFLFMPVRVAQQISPAFRNWRNRDRLIAWGQFAGAVGVQYLIGRGLGFTVWAYTFGLPLIAFAWIWSLMVYVFHYHTTLGEPTRYNVRAIAANRGLRWWLMNFNQHATHHLYPNIPWYELPQQAATLPEPYAQKNATARSLVHAVLDQLRGPTVVYARESRPAAWLFVHWED